MRTKVGFTPSLFGLNKKVKKFCKKVLGRLYRIIIKINQYNIFPLKGSLYSRRRGTFLYCVYVCIVLLTMDEGL